MTTIETADLRLELDRPWPPDCEHGVLSLEGFTTDAVQFGFVSSCGPDDRRLDDAWRIVDDRGRFFGAVPGTGRFAFGPWPTLSAACDAAWQAVDAHDVDLDADPQAQVRLARELDLHRCERCMTTWRGQVDPAVVLHPRTRVEIESPEGALVFTGEVAEWGPKLVDAVVAAGQREIRAIELEAEHWRAIAGIRAQRLRLLGIVAAAQGIAIAALVIGMMAC